MRSFCTIVSYGLKERNGIGKNSHVLNLIGNQVGRLFCSKLIIIITITKIITGIKNPNRIHLKFKIINIKVLKLYYVCLLTIQQMKDQVEALELIGSKILNKQQQTIYIPRMFLQETGPFLLEFYEKQVSETKQVYLFQIKKMEISVKLLNDF